MFVNKYKDKTKSTVKYFVKTFPKKGLIADIGARDGYSSDLLRKAGFEVVATDIKPENPFVIFDDIMDTKLIYKYDYIYSRHVIEHTINADKFFKSCKKLLKKNGILFMTFPLESKEKFIERNQGKPRKEWNHKMYFPDIGSFRKVAEKYFKTKKLCYSKEVGIKPTKVEVLLIGIVK